MTFVWSQIKYNVNQSAKYCIVIFLVLFMLYTSLVAQMVKCLPAMQEIQVRSLGWEDPLEKEMATHSSILAWEIPWTQEPGGLQSTGSQRVGHDWATSLSLSKLNIISLQFSERKWRCLEFYCYYFSTSFIISQLLLFSQPVVSDSVTPWTQRPARPPCP